MFWFFLILKTYIELLLHLEKDFPDGVMVKKPPANAGDARDLGSTPGSGRSPGEGNGNPLQCSCLENPRDRGAWWAAVCEVAQSQTRLKRLSSSSSQYLAWRIPWTEEPDGLQYGVTKSQTQLSD